MSRWIFRNIVYVFVYVLCIGCVTFVDDPGKFRRNSTSNLGGGKVGDNFALSYLQHFGKHSGLALEFEQGGVTSQKFRLEKDLPSINEDSEIEYDDRKIYEQRRSLNASVLVFPSAKSSFFFGMGVKTQRIQTAYDEHTLEFALHERKTNVEWVDTGTIVAAPIGFAKNTVSGFTFIAALRPMYRVSNHRKFLDDGSTGNVDLLKREDSLKTLDKQNNSSYEMMWLTTYGF